MAKIKTVAKAMTMQEIEAMVLADLAAAQSGQAQSGYVLIGGDEQQEPGEVEAAATATATATAHTGRLGWNLDGLL